MEPLQARAQHASPEKRIPPGRVTPDDKPDKIVSFSLLISNLAGRSVGRSPWHLVPHPETARQDLGRSRRSSRGQKGLKDSGKAVWFPGLGVPNKPEGKPLSRSGNKARLVSPLTQQGRKSQGSLNPPRDTDSLNEGKIFGDDRYLCPSDQSRPLLDGGVQSRMGSNGRPRKMLERSMVAGGKFSTHQCLRTSHHTLRSKINRPKGSKSGIMVGQHDSDKRHPKIRLSLSRLQKLARLLQEELEQRRISIMPRHIAGKQNVASNALSR